MQKKHYIKHLYINLEPLKSEYFEIEQIHMRI